MRTRYFRFLPVLIALGCVATLGSLAQSYGGGHHARSLITAPIDESRLVTLGGNTRFEANAANDRGPVVDSMPLEHLQLMLKRPPELEKELETLIENQQRRSSPEFHHWLNAVEFGERFGVSHEDIQKVTDWLEHHGFQVDSVFTNGVVIEFTGNAGQLKNAFHTEIHNLDVNGERHIANISDPKVPAALAGVVHGIYALNDFKPHKLLKKRKEYTTGNASWPYLVAPADLATMYNLNPAFAAGITGNGQTIVVVEDTNVFTTADWATFRSTFGLTGYSHGTFTQVSPPKPTTGGAICTNPGVNSDEDEAMLDAEWASASAPNAKIVLASCADRSGVSGFGGLIAIENLENSPAPYPQIVSMSYGECEPSDGAAGNAAFNTAFQQAAAEGTSVFVSSGDELAASCDGGNYSATHGITVSGWMSSVYDVSVGGTDFADAYLAVEGSPAVPQSTYWSDTNTAAYGSLLSYLPETTWTNSCTSALFDVLAGTSASALCNAAGQSTAGAYDSYGGSGGPSNCATGATTTSGVATAGCAGWPKPSWQVAPGVPADGVRDTPDVSLMASNGQWGHYYPACDSDPNFPNNFDSCSGTPDNWGGGGGTSFSSPIMAGIQALVNEANGETTGVGNPNSRYYALGALEFGTPSNLAACNSMKGAGIGSGCVFNDVTLGDISSACDGDFARSGTLTGTFNCFGAGGTRAAPVYGVSSLTNATLQEAYPTTSGWDFATGLGSVNGYNLIKDWVKVQTSTTAAAPSTTVGQPVTLTATVAPSIGSNATGTVSWSSNTGCAPSAVSGGVAHCTTSFSTAGSHSVTATYGGDATYAGSAGSKSVSVVTAAPTVILTTTATVTGSSAGGFTATVTVTNTGTGPAGNVTLTTATLGGVAALSGIPDSMGVIAPGGSASATVTFSGVGTTDGQHSSESYAGTYGCSVATVRHPLVKPDGISCGSSGIFSGGIRVTLP